MELETRVVKVEERQTYADSARSNNVSLSTVDHTRVEKLEYQNSEQERSKRILQATISHP